MAEARPLVLLVEDHAANVRLMEALLGRAGYRWVAAPSLEAARAALAETRPSLILLDLGLRDGDGLELLAHPAAAGVPVVALTAYAMAADRGRALGAGCVGFLTKPLDTRGFAAALAAALATTGQGGACDDPHPGGGR